MSDATDANDTVDHPHPIWWIAVIGGLTLLAFIAFSPPFYEKYTAAVHTLPAQKWMAWLFYACIPIHVFEAGYAWKVAGALGLEKSRAGWAAQCFVLGYPSTHLLNKRKKAAA